MLCQVYGASNCCLLRQLDHTTIVEVYESLFWLQTSVQAFQTNAIDGISHSFTELSHGDLVLRNTFLVVYGIIYYVRSTITHILGNLKRMRTITHAIGTRSSFFDLAFN